jgi:multiple sugar transport system substrate-binding protein
MGAAATGLGPTIVVRRAAARSRRLTIAQWAHVIPAFDHWFDRTFVRDWSERNGIQIAVDHLGVNELRARAAAEVSAQQGHDLFGLLAPIPAYEEHVLPLNDVAADCERECGRMLPLARDATYNPTTQRYFALANFWAPNLLHYRVDWWGDVGVKPDTWERIRDGARKIKDKHGAPAGFGLAPELDSEMTLRGLLWSYGAAEQDEAGRVTINSRPTVEAIKLMTAIFKEAMVPDVFLWDASSNNRLFVWGRGSIIQNAISAIRSAETLNPSIARKSALARPAAGPVARLGSAHVLHGYVVWGFAANPEAAKKFLVDLVAASRDAFLSSAFYNCPTFPQAVPDLPGALAGDKDYPQRYRLLADAPRWSAWPGYPGFFTLAVGEVLDAFVISRMFARAASGQQRAEESARQAELEMQRIFARWMRQRRSWRGGF